jgi:pyridoxal phosphate phosphatase PHOSPHO2
LKDYLNKIELNNDMPLIYVGDGNNDYCPGRLLSDKDFFCVKNNHSLAKLLKNEELKKEIKSQLVYWSDANEIISQIDILKYH